MGGVFQSPTGTDARGMIEPALRRVETPTRPVHLSFWGPYPPCGTFQGLAGDERPPSRGVFRKPDGHPVQVTPHATSVDATRNPQSLTCLEWAKGPWDKRGIV